jgi:hypothetical protein
MTTIVHTLLIGPSPEGAFVHDSDADFDGVFQGRLEDVQDAAAEFVGYPLRWRWMEERQVWRAEVRYGNAAEIHSAPRLERIIMAVTSM